MRRTAFLPPASWGISSGFFYDHTPLDPPVITKVAVTVTASTPTPTSTPAPSPSPAGKNATIDLIAQSFTFDKKTITVPAGAAVTINFNNKDTAPHNFALYTDQTAYTLIFRGNQITGPATTTYTFTAPTTAGSYFFRCDVHPSAMTGSFVVTAPTSSSSNGGGGY